jgi:hypothetical protein
MKRLWMALLFFFGGFASEVRQPLDCHTVTVRFDSRRPPESRR